MKSITDKLIVTTDLGHLKAYLVSRESYEASLSIELIHDQTFKDYLSHATDHESAQTHRHHLQHMAGLIDGIAKERHFDGIFLAAPHTLLHGLIDHLEQELVLCGFLRNDEKRPTMMVNLRNMLQRADLTEQEIRTLRGIVTELRYGRRPYRPPRQKAPQNPPEGGPDVG